MRFERADNVCVRRVALCPLLELERAPADEALIHAPNREILPLASEQPCLGGEVRRGHAGGCGELTGVDPVCPERRLEVGDWVCAQGVSAHLPTRIGILTEEQVQEVL